MVLSLSVPELDLWITPPLGSLPGRPFISTLVRSFMQLGTDLTLEEAKKGMSQHLQTPIPFRSEPVKAAQYLSGFTPWPMEGNRSAALR